MSFHVSTASPLHHPNLQQRARAAIAYAGENSWLSHRSAAENKFLGVIRKGGLDEPETQVSVESDTEARWRLDIVPLT